MDQTSWADIIKRKWAGGFTPRITALALLAAAVLWLAGSSFPLIDRLLFDNTNYMRPLSNGHIFVQTFKAPLDNLSRVDIQIDKASSQTTGSLHFQLAEITGEGDLLAPGVWGKVIRRIDFDAADIDPYEWHRFKFSPIPDSGGKNYAVMLWGEAPETDGIRPRGSGGDRYQEGILFIDGKKADFDLSLSLFHETNAPELLAKNSPFRPWPLSSRLLFVFLFLVGTVAFGWLLGVIIRDGH